jgi:hypothetical protein
MDKNPSRILLFFLSPFILSFLYLLTCVYILCATSPTPFPGGTPFSDFVEEKA